MQTATKDNQRLVDAHLDWQSSIRNCSPHTVRFTAVPTSPVRIAGRSDRSSTFALSDPSPEGAGSTLEPSGADTCRQKTLRPWTRPHFEMAPARDGRMAKKSPQKPPPMAPPSAC